MNQIENGNIEQLLEPNEEFSYLRSPAGVCTKIVVPASAIKEKIGDRIINGLNFSMKAMPQEEWLYAFEAPDNVLLLPEDSVQSFFENNKIEDNVTSYLATFGEYATNTYSFGNISSLLQVHLENKPDEDLNLILLPVLRGTQNSSSSWGSSGKPYTTSITNYMKPSGVRLKKDKEAIEHNKKLHFTTDTDYLKMATIHSFKGWEASNVIFILEPESTSHAKYSISAEENVPELIYTAITRAKENLFIINLGNDKYHNFFNSNI